MSKYRWYDANNGEWIDERVMSREEAIEAMEQAILEEEANPDLVEPFAQRGEQFLANIDDQDDLIDAWSVGKGETPQRY